MGIGREECMTEAYVYNKYEYWIPIINNLTHKEMAIIWRFAPDSHEIFSDSKIFSLFVKRFYSLGGFTLKISKEIGHTNIYDINKIIREARARVRV